MPFFDGFELIFYARDAEVEDKLFLRWVSGYQSVYGFKEFKAQFFGNQESENNQSAEEILFKVKDIIG